MPEAATIAAAQESEGADAIDYSVDETAEELTENIVEAAAEENKE